MNIDIKIKEEATLWVTCEKEGLSQNQKEQFNKWIKQNPSHKKAYERMKMVHFVYSSLSRENSQKLSEKANVEIRKERFLWRNKIIVSAASILLLLCLGLFMNYNTNTLEFSQNYVSNTNKIHKQKLPDGTIISLDAKTNIELKFYKDKRIAILKRGKVLFDVASNKQKPFIIETSNANIEVVGTKFEVVSSKKNTKVNVEEGRVRTYYLSSKKNKKSVIILGARDTITYSNFGKVSNYKKISPEEIALWRNDIISLDEITLKKAISKFSNYSALPIKISSKEIESYLITGEFSSNQIDIFLKTITKIYPIEVIKKDSFIEISKKN